MGRVRTPLHLGAPGLARRGQGDAAGHVVDHGVDQRVLVRQVVVERHRLHAQALRQLAHRQRGHAAGVGQRDGGVHHLLARQWRARRQRAAGGRGPASWGACAHTYAVSLNIPGMDIQCKPSALPGDSGLPRQQQAWVCRAYGGPDAAAAGAPAAGAARPGAAAGAGAGHHGGERRRAHPQPDHAARLRPARAAGVRLAAAAPAGAGQGAGGPGAGGGAGSACAACCAARAARRRHPGQQRRRRRRPCRPSAARQPARHRAPAGRAVGRRRGGAGVRRPDGPALSRPRRPAIGLVAAGDRCHRRGGQRAGAAGARARRAGHRAGRRGESGAGAPAGRQPGAGLPAAPRHQPAAAGLRRGGRHLRRRVVWQLPAAAAAGRGGFEEKKKRSKKAGSGEKYGYPHK